MYYETVSNDDATPVYYNVTKKKYMKNGMEKIMV